MRGEGRGQGPRKEERRRRGEGGGRGKDGRERERERERGREGGREIKDTALFQVFPNKAIPVVGEMEYIFQIRQCIETLLTHNLS